MRKKLTPGEQKYLEAWRGLEKLDQELRINPKTKDAYERLVERLRAKNPKKPDHRT
jgi:hypothetical protein